MRFYSPEVNVIKFFSKKNNSEKGNIVNQFLKNNLLSIYNSKLFHFWFLGESIYLIANFAL